ncbi:WD40/YVTN/BNR-like repeat-containing protein [Paenibacillus alkalitolerans]|uniref:WD40/YVTN/BNR-like repeat-containing protein n=1 Tax=Paenibacillus alkalitolerans TaxID=2799335 RepID=UPI0018F27FC4|nr:hypothetical protein [Paenibacillus alkalitolerans]
MKCKYIMIMFLCLLVILSGCSKTDDMTSEAPVNQNESLTADNNKPKQTKPSQDNETNSPDEPNITKVQDLTADCSKVVIPTNKERDTHLDKEKEMLTVYWYDETKEKDVGVVFRYTDPNCSESASQVSAHVLQDTQSKIILNSIHMINETTGWAMTNRGVLRTINGGEQWENVFPLDLGKAGYDNPRFKPYFFMDSLHAWVALDGGPITIFRTSDGGETWEKSEIKEQSMTKYLTFLNPNEGWLMSFIDAETGGKELVDIYQTRDGGSNWVKIASTFPNNELNNFPLEGVKSGLTFLNATKGWAAGALTNAEGVTWLYQTDDGGHNWKQIQLPPLPNFKDSLIATELPMFFDEKEGILPVWTNQLNISENRFHKIFYSTMDGGKTWTSSTPLKSEGGAIHDFISVKQGLVITGGKLYVTDNGGESWKTIEPNEEFKKNLQIIK